MALTGRIYAATLQTTRAARIYAATLATVTTAKARIYAATLVGQSIVPFPDRTADPGEEVVLQATTTDGSAPGTYTWSVVSGGVTLYIPKGTGLDERFEGTDGDPLDGWTVISASGSARKLGGQAAQITGAAGAFTRCDQPTSQPSADCGIMLSVTPDITTADTQRTIDVVINSDTSGTGASPTGGLRLRFTNGTVTLGTLISGTFAQLATVAGSLPGGQTYRVHVNRTGTTVSANWWAAGSREPSGWMLTATSATLSGITAKGITLSTSSGTGGSGTTLWDDLRVRYPLFGGTDRIAFRAPATLAGTAVVVSVTAGGAPTTATTTVYPETLWLLDATGNWSGAGPMGLLAGLDR